MRIEFNGRRIVLSRRNLLALLHKLDEPDSMRSLYKDGVLVSVEENDEHYPESYLPGPMTPDTEVFIKERDR
jgi:hypothetical protein